MQGITFAHHHRKWQHIWILPIRFVEAAGVIVKDHIFDTVAGYKHVDLGDWTENTLLSQVVHLLVNMLMPLIRCPELLILHQLELIRCNIAKHRIDRKFILKIHRECFLSVREADKDILVWRGNQLVNKLFKLFRLRLLYALGHHDELLDETDLLDDLMLRL